MKRATLQHGLRLKYNAAAVRFTPTEEALAQELFKLCVFNPYSAIRKKAQAALQRTVRCLPSVKSQFVSELIAVIDGKDTLPSQLKGALYTLKLKSLLSLCVKRWDHQLEFMTTLVRAQREEKPSIQDLIRNIYVDFTLCFSPLQLGELTFTKEFENLALSLSSRRLEAHELDRRRRLQTARIEENAGYHRSILNSLSEVLTSAPHWRFELMSAGFLHLVLRQEISTDAVTWFYNSLRNDLPQARRLAVNAVVQILYFLKCRARAGSTHLYKIDIPVPQPVTEVFEANFRASISEPVTEENQDRVLFVADLSVGWYSWPASYQAYRPGKPYTEDKGFNVEHLRKLLNLSDFWRDFTGFLAQESTVGTTTTPFNSLNAQFFKSVFKHFEDEFLDKILPHLKALCENSTDRGSQRAAAELIAGLCRGSKLWSLEKKKHLASLLGPLLTRTFEDITPDTLSDWNSALIFCLVSLHRLRLT